MSKKVKCYKRPDKILWQARCSHQTFDNIKLITLIKSLPPPWKLISIAEMCRVTALGVGAEIFASMQNFRFPYSRQKLTHNEEIFQAIIREHCVPIWRSNENRLLKALCYFKKFYSTQLLTNTPTKHSCSFTQSFFVYTVSESICPRKEKHTKLVLHPKKYKRRTPF